jgi:single-strand DNA-binding protein
MNNLRNRVQLIGHLGANPEVKTFDGGKTKASVSIATNEVYYNAKGEKIEDTQWHNIVMWGKTAEIADKYLKKGAEICVEGKLTSRSYETKEGEKRYITEVVVSEMVMLGKKGE